MAAWRRTASGEVRLLYLAPERLMTERMLEALAKLDVRLIAIDEAHCVSQWGPAFRPEYRALSKLADLFPNIPIIALTATADEVTRADIALQLFDNRVETMVQGFDRPNISLTVESKHNTNRQLLDFIARHKGKSGIVYCLSRKKTEKVAALLAENGVRALAYHAGMDKDTREANQNAFMTEPAVVMVATIAFGMGIDKADVRFVFHTDLPGSLEAYYQEIGRAGRDGGPAEAHMLFGLEDIRMRRVFIDQEDAGEDRKRREHARLNMLLAYCEASRCRRQLLLSYFGERSEPCGNCDPCREPSERIDSTEDARKILTAIRATGERFGAIRIIEALADSSRKKEEWQSLIRQMAGDGLLRHDVQGYGGLEMTEKGRALLRGDGTFESRPVQAARAQQEECARRCQSPSNPMTIKSLIASAEGAAPAPREGKARAALCDLLRQVADRHGAACVRATKASSAWFTASAPPSSRTSARSSCARSANTRRDLTVPPQYDGEHAGHFATQSGRAESPRPPHQAAKDRALRRGWIRPARSNGPNLFPRACSPFCVLPPLRSVRAPPVATSRLRDTRISAVS